MKAAADPRVRVVISGVDPEIDGGRFPIKRVVGQRVIVEADIFADGHDAISAVLTHRREDDSEWHETFMEPLGNDRWRAAFEITSLHNWRYSLFAWINRYRSWLQDLTKRVRAGQDISVEIVSGIEQLERAARRASPGEREQLETWAELLLPGHELADADRLKIAGSDLVLQLMDRVAERQFGVAYPRELRVSVDRPRAQFSAWYEMFPRSCSAEPGRHGTFADCEERLAYIAGMGFDVLYLPPIHPIGRSHRKGKNNAPHAERDDVGSPWAIGSSEGGHTSIHPQLGTLADFRRLREKADSLGIELALDIAWQCSPDHPYVREHPEWFQMRADGSIRYAENPPKKYQDIYPINFESVEHGALWDELRDVVRFWIGQGVRIFRVDNPHTKPFAFWEWMIGEIRAQHRDVIFLSEAFTRPSVMYQLAKLGFTQSYTYFAWRNTKWELTEYLTELTQGELREYFRPNLWPNTPDILTEYLQTGGRPAFVARLVLAATLSASYGIYGPAFELCENRAVRSQSEEYLDSEKYQIRQWPIDSPDSLHELIGVVNRARQDNPALHGNESLRFHDVDNEQLICYSKHANDFENIIVVVVNLDPYHTQSGILDLPVADWQIPGAEPYQAHDLLSEARYLWHGPRNYVELDPHACPAHILKLRRRVRSERDFEYYH